MKYSIQPIIRTDRKNSKGQCPIAIRISYGGKSSKYHLGISILESQFNTEEGYARKSHESFNTINQAIIDAVKKVEFYLKDKITLPSHKELLMALDNSKKKEDAVLISNVNKEFVNYYYQFLKEYSVSKRLTDASINTYQNSIYHIKAFLETYEIDSWDTIGDSLFDNLTIFLSNEQELKHGSIHRIVKNLKTYFSWLDRTHRIIETRQYKNFKSPKDYGVGIALSRTDIEVMKYNLQLSIQTLGEGYDKVKVVLNHTEQRILRSFLFLCYSGTSYLDFTKLKWTDVEKRFDSITGDSYLVITYLRQKTKKDNNVLIVFTEDIVDLLLTEIAFQIVKLKDSVNNSALRKVLNTDQIKLNLTSGTFEKKSEMLYDIIGSIKEAKDIIVQHYPFLFEPTRNNYFNRHLKVLTGKLGFNDEIKINISAKGTTEQKVVNRNEIISAHTARRSFITHSLEDQVPYHTLMKSTGHLNIQTLMTYHRNNEEAVAKTILQLRQPYKSISKVVDKKVELIRENKKK
jgi:integrase